MPTNWVYRNSDFVWMVQDVGDPALIHTQPSAYTLVTLAQDGCPNPITTRGQATSPFIRAATASELAEVERAKLDGQADLALRALLDHLLVALAEKLPSVVITYAGYAPRQFAESVRNRVIELNRTPSTRPKKGG